VREIRINPIVPENVSAKVVNSREFHRKHHHRIFCATIDAALIFKATIYGRGSGEVRRKIGVGQYVVERDEKFIAVKPFASRYEWEFGLLILVMSAYKLFQILSS